MQVPKKLEFVILIFTIYNFVDAEALFEGCNKTVKMDSFSIYVFQSENYTANDASKKYAAGSSCLSHYISPPGSTILLNGQYSLDVNTLTPNCYGQGQRFLVSRDGNRNFTDADVFCASGVVALDSVGTEMSLGYVSDKSGQGRFQVFVRAVNITKNNCNCGWGADFKLKPANSSKLYKGFTSTVGVLHTERDVIVCTGVIVTANYVLSSASCYFQSTENTAQNLQIVTGYKEYPSIVDPFYTAAYPIESIKIHENYSNIDASQLNDLAVIKLKNSILFTRGVSPICMPLTSSFANEQFYTQKVFEFVGWSLPTNDGTQQFLNNMLASYTTIQQCATYFQPLKMSDKLCLNRINSTILYPEYPGSPVFYTSGESKILVGIYNAQFNQSVTKPMVFTRIVNYIPWIKADVGNDLICSR